MSSKMLSVCPLQHFLVKNFSVKNDFLPSFSDIQQKLVSFFRNIFSQLDKTALYETKISIWGLNFVLTKFLFVSFHVLPNLNGEITVFFHRKAIGRFVTTAYHVSKKIFRRIFLEKIFLLFIWFWATFLCHFDKNLSVPPVCGEKKFVKDFFLPSISDIDRNWSVFVRNCLGQVDDTAFYESKGSFWRHKTVLTNICLFHLSIADHKRKCKVFLGNKRQGRENCLPRVQGDMLKNFFLEIFCLSFHHWALSKFFCHSDELFVVCRSGCENCFLFVNCTILWWKFFVRNVFLPSFSDIQQKSIFFETFSENLAELHSTSPKDHFEGISLFW